MIGYAVTVKPMLASYRLRVAIPAPHMGLDYRIGEVGNPTFFYKLGNPEIAKRCEGGVVYDVVNDHFETEPSVRQMAYLADKLTVGSEAMAETVYRRTGRPSTVIDDPYENEEWPARVSGHRVLWFGHIANMKSLLPHARLLRGLDLVVCTNSREPKVIEWTPQAELVCLDRCAVVLLTGSNPGASTNRVVKAIRAGRFVVMPEDCPQSWRQFEPYVWIGNVRDGVHWARQHREEACSKIAAGQDYIRKRFSPQSIGSQWAALFGSI